MSKPGTDDERAATEHAAALEAARRTGAPREQQAEIERELLTDPCGVLRRACQVADYGAIPDAPGHPEARDV